MAVKKNYTLTPKAIWGKACKYDKIPADSKFVVFSPKNPWAKEYDKAMKMVGMARKHGLTNVSNWSKVKKAGEWGKKKKPILWRGSYPKVPRWVMKKKRK